MSIDRLRYFVAIGQELSFVRAAARLHVTQSALSQQLRRLEQDIGQTLVARTPRVVALTDAGRALFPEAREIVQRYDRLPSLSASAARGGAGVIRPAAVPSAIIGLLPPPSSPSSSASRRKCRSWLRRSGRRNKSSVSVRRPST